LAILKKIKKLFANMHINNSKDLFAIKIEKTYTLWAILEKRMSFK
jgi:hypothetical protein